MGGEYYERAMSDTHDTHAGYSAAADTVFAKKSQADPTTTPSDRTITCEAANPVVVAIDVTGSMGAFPRIIFDKLPMFYGQIMMQGYLKDPAVSFCGIGDVDYDQAPLQVTDFAQGTAIDTEVSKIWVEGNGGDAAESYEYAALYYGYRCSLPNVEGGKGFLFITGDEVPKTVTLEKVKSVLGVEMERAPTNEEIFERCRAKFHVFYLCKTSSGKVPQKVMKAWGPLVGEENIMPLINAKAVVDAMLGCISVVSGARSFESYVADMQTRGQTDERIAEIHNAMAMMTSASSSKKE
eukprot:PhM_4_TR1227/c0_g1_i1/m.24316